MVLFNVMHKLLHFNYLESGYFAVDDILSLEAILHHHSYVFKRYIATVLAVIDAVVYWIV